MAPATNSSSSSDTESEKAKMTHTINIENLEWSKCCIYKVPCNLRKVKEEAYTPQLISIGPFHHGSTEELEPMEKQKLRYFQYFREQRVSNEKALESYRLSLEGEETNIRNCYAEKLHDISSKEFIDMLLLDAVFIVEHFLRTTSKSRPKEEEGKKENSKSFRLNYNDDYIVTQSWLSKSIQRDLLLLENQLPMYVLNTLYGYVDAELKEHTCFLDLARTYFAIFDTHKSSLDESTKLLQVSEHNKCNLHEEEGEEPKHFTDLVRSFYLPSPTYLANNSGHCDNPKGLSVLRTATKLQGAGVSFEKVDLHQRRLLDINFKKKPILSRFLCLGGLPRSKYFKARFQIPELKIDHMTECVLRNLIALEQCHYPLEPYICNYVSLIDSLIHTKDDVELLVEKEVIVHELGSDKEVATLVNGLCKHVVTNTTCYNKLIGKLNKHYQEIWYSSMATLRLVYFRDPWRGSGTVVGITIFLLTVLGFYFRFRVLF